MEANVLFVIHELVQFILLYNTSMMAPHRSETNANVLFTSCFLGFPDTLLIISLIAPPSSGFSLAPNIHFMLVDET